MTTKQKIIDYIERNIPREFYDEKLAIIRAIKDLKPSVKKMGWVKMGNSLVSTGVDEEYVIDSLSKSNLVVINKLSGYFKDIEQAQEACQNHYEESILGSVEYE